ncbi:MAG: hypothetical protein MZW92_63385 [Comamonadaceae bacterium]|nr:hypothetical protein [Comamonadaceae bacterium]
MDRAPRRAAAAGAGAMSSDASDDDAAQTHWLHAAMPCRAPLALLRPLPRGGALARRGRRTAIQSITSTPAGRRRGRPHRARASRWPRCPPASRCQSPPRIAIDLPGVGNAIGRSSGRDQPGQPALGQRRAGRRAHAPGAQPASRPPSYRAQLAGQGAAGACSTARSRRAGGRRRPAQPAHFAPAQNAETQRAARHRLPPRRRRRRPRRRRPAEHAGRRRHPPAGPEPGGRVPALDAARRAAPPARRHRLRHAGAAPCRTVAERRPRAHGRRAARRLGAQRLPERQPVRARGAADEGRPEQADAGPGLPGREAVA